MHRLRCSGIFHYDVTIKALETLWSTTNYLWRHNEKQAKCVLSVVWRVKSRFWTIMSKELSNGLLIIIITCILVSCIKLFSYLLPTNICGGDVKGMYICLIVYIHVILIRSDDVWYFVGVCVASLHSNICYTEDAFWQGREAQARQSGW